MPHHREIIGQSVVDRLVAAEKAIDVAIAAVADLAGFLPAARIDAKLAAEVGHGALKNSAAALHHLTRARASMIKTHKALKATGDQLGLGEVNFGGLYGKPTALAPAVSQAGVGSVVDGISLVRAIAT